MTRKYRTALFAGSFNPFTVGHMSIVERILKICDKVIVAIGHNLEKPADDIEKRVEKLQKAFAHRSDVEVRCYTGLTVDFAAECNADFLVRGVRDATDFEYERRLAETNLKISGIETVLLPALPEIAYISSSMVRELAAHGRNVDEFLV